MKQRERARGNRCIGSAEASQRYLFPKAGYDIRIDSGMLNPDEAAERIAVYMNLTGCMDGCDVYKLTLR